MKTIMTTLTPSPSPSPSTDAPVVFTTSTTGLGTGTAWYVAGFQCKELRRTPEYPTRWKTYPGGGVEFREHGTSTMIHLREGSTIQVRPADTRSADGVQQTIAVWKPRDVVRVETGQERGGDSEMGISPVWNGTRRIAVYTPLPQGVVHRTHIQYSSMVRPDFVGFAPLSASGTSARWLSTAPDASIHIITANETAEIIPVPGGSIVLCEPAPGGWVISVPVARATFDGEFSNNMPHLADRCAIRISKGHNHE